MISCTSGIGLLDLSHSIASTQSSAGYDAVSLSAPGRGLADYLEIGARRSLHFRSCRCCCVCVVLARPTAGLASVRAASTLLLPPVFNAFLASWASKTTKRQGGDAKGRMETSPRAAHSSYIARTYGVSSLLHESAILFARVIAAVVDLSHLD